MLYSRFPNNLVIKFIGTWEAKQGGGQQLFAISGLSYYMQPPLNLQEALLDPIKTVIYVLFVLGTCAFFSKTWIEVSGTAPRDVAKQFKDQGLVIAGHRETSVYKELKKIIPTAAAFGGATIGALSVVSDMFGCLGSGTSILMAATTIYSYYEMAAKEETGWGEFEIIIKIFFHTEGGEKNVTLIHHLKLHPYNGLVSMDGKVESVRYDEIVFNEPTEKMFALLTKQPGSLLDDKLKSREREELDRIAKAIDDITEKTKTSTEEFKKLDKERQSLVEM
ncbi:hypothetical protein PMKS-001839 [Pichia membranifaciens]|uniref:YEATS domain-containing protein n=1 Tax=Pichia membranifaciens TaxID=4926 RepID=A0A1Q2YFS7_9ASCO|nr:hypothetical protein PMKS-001839 [Pichia membranifaciens]